MKISSVVYLERTIRILGLSFIAGALFCGGIGAAVAAETRLAPSLVVEPSVDEVRLIEKRAIGGEAAAQEQLCLIWFLWRGGITTAAGGNWCRTAAERGSLEASVVLAEVAFEGRLGAVNAERGRRLLTQAAEAGNLYAQVRLAGRYYFGSGMSQDRPTGCRWYIRAAKSGSPEAQTMASDCHAFGYGVEPNPEEARRLLKAAADQGFQPAIERQAENEKRKGSKRTDPKEMFEYTLSLAEKGDPVAQRFLAMAYESGHGVPKNTEESMMWLLRAADSGDPEAQFLAGTRFYVHPDFGHDFAKAWFYFSLAADQSHQLALELLEELRPFMNERLLERAAEMGPEGGVKK